MKPSHLKIISHYDEERERAFLAATVLFWVVVGLFLVLRDPLWRLFYEGQIVSRAPRASTWVELDEKLVSQLSSVNVAPRAGVDNLEKELIDAVNRRRVKEAAAAGATLAPASQSPPLLNIARARAAARIQPVVFGQPQAPELLYPEIYFALALSDRLTRAVEVYQRLSLQPAPGSPAPDELVGGWMNGVSFASLLQQAGSLEIGAGAVSPPQGGASLEVLLVEPFLQFDKPLPALVKRGAPLGLGGRRLSSDEVTLYWKGPADPSFTNLPVQWSGDRFTCTLNWNQGPGTYALRARRTDRLSDPRPIFVK